MMAQLQLFSQVTLVVVFVTSLASKLRDPNTFHKSLKSMELVPGSWSLVSAWSVIGFELVAVTLLVVAKPYGLLLALGLLIAFTLALLKVLHTSSGASCGCFGKQRPVNRVDVLRNIGLLTLTGLGILTLEARIEPYTISHLITAAMASIFAYVWMHLDDLAYLLLEPLRK